MRSVVNDFIYLPAINCSAIGPSAQAGMNVKAPTITMTPIKSATNKGVWVGSVPKPAGTCFFLASDPAMASTGMITQNRPRNMVSPSAVL